jgi:IclR family transcriptional regulator, KDG regulon repressor
MESCFCTIQSAMKPSTSIHKVSLVLGSFNSRPSMGITELARNTRLLPSDVHRIATSLKHFGYLDQNPQTKQYRLGLELLRLGHLVHERIKIPEVARPFLFRLSESTDATANLAILDAQAGQIIFVDQVDCPREVQIKLRMGAVASPHATSVGKILTSFMDPMMAEHVLKAHGLNRNTRNTITDPQKLQSEFEAIRSLGFAVDREEAVEGACCVGAPVRDHRGNVVAAVSISMLAFRMDRSGEQQLVSLVKKTGDRISAALGYAPSLASRAAATQAFPK